MKTKYLPVLLSLFVFTPVVAEEIRYKPETVTTRLRPELAPLGARAGAFRLFPRLTISEQYNDNLFATNTNEESDFITLIRPELNAESLWNRHSLRISSYADIGLHGDNDREDYEDYSFAADGNFELSSAQSFLAGYQYRHDHEQRSSPDDVFGIEPTELDTNRVYGTYIHKFNRIIVELGGSFTNIDFDDTAGVSGLAIDNDDRDRDRTAGTLKLGYEYLPEYTAYIETSINEVDYDQQPDNNGFNRDSDGYAVTVGTDLDLSGVLFGNLFIGYDSQSYDDPLLNDVDGITGGLSLIWLPSQLTTVTGSISRSIEETTLGAASGVFATDASIIVDHELRRNLLVQANLSIAEDDFEGINRSDTYYSAGIGARYMINRHFYLLANYNWLQRDSDVVTNVDDFSRNVVSIGAQIQL